MPNSESNLLIQSPPIKVEFLGFESNTHILQEAGWQLSVRQSINHYDPTSMSCEIAMKHEQARLYALSTPISINRCISSPSRLGTPGYFTEMFHDTCFRVVAVSSEIIHTEHVTSRDPRVEGKFMPIDARPQYQNIDFSKQCISDMAIFRPISPDSEIVIHPDSVVECLEYIQKLQAPKQRDIREKKRKESMRNAVRDKLDGKIDGYDAARDIKAQIVVVGG